MDLKDLEQYDLLREKKVDEVNSTAFLLEHKKSGARLFLLSNDDENKVFSIGFRTPPSDSTGVAHILEHSVLCGSEKFPVKDPFVELVKGSLNTFLNAMTVWEPEISMFLCGTPVCSGKILWKQRMWCWRICPAPVWG